jgi:ABC-type uncharacterized transport system permease subunit
MNGVQEFKDTSMNKTDRWESIILLLSAIILLPIWLIRSQQLPVSVPLGLINALQVVLVIVLVVIFVRRFRRMLAALRENRNRQGPFSF